MYINIDVLSKKDRNKFEAKQISYLPLSQNFLRTASAILRHALCSINLNGSVHTQAVDRFPLSYFKREETDDSIQR
jgi:hypothetical protein